MVNCGILLKEFKLSVYPLFLRRRHVYDKYEEQSANYFSEYFLKIFPDLFNPVQKINAFFSIQPFGDKRNIRMNYFYSTLLGIYASQYAYWLQIKKGVMVRNIFYSYIKGDGELREDQTLKFFRNLRSLVTSKR